MGAAVFPDIRTLRGELQSAILELERDFTVHTATGFPSEDGRDWTRCPTGKEYEELAVRGACNLVNEWARQMRSAVAGQGTHLWWRTLPTVEVIPLNGKPDVGIYCRFAVTKDADHV